MSHYASSTASTWSASFFPTALSMPTLYRRPVPYVQLSSVTVLEILDTQARLECTALHAVEQPHTLDLSQHSYSSVSTVASDILDKPERARSSASSATSALSSCYYPEPTFTHLVGLGISHHPELPLSPSLYRSEIYCPRLYRPRPEACFDLEELVALLSVAYENSAGNESFNTGVHFEMVHDVAGAPSYPPTGLDIDYYDAAETGEAASPTFPSTPTFPPEEQAEEEMVCPTFTRFAAAKALSSCFPPGSRFSDTHTTNAQLDSADNSLERQANNSASSSFDVAQQPTGGQTLSPFLDALSRYHIHLSSDDASSESLGRLDGRRLSPIIAGGTHADSPLLLDLEYLTVAALSLGITRRSFSLDLIQPGIDPLTGSPPNTPSVSLTRSGPFEHSGCIPPSPASSPPLGCCLPVVLASSHAVSAARSTFSASSFSRIAWYSDLVRPGSIATRYPPLPFSLALSHCTSLSTIVAYFAFRIYGILVFRS
ncbi:hypothetical protein JCM11641_005867 [Rhodosporidiobolus odoratus]